MSVKVLSLVSDHQRAPVPSAAHPGRHQREYSIRGGTGNPPFSRLYLVTVVGSFPGSDLSDHSGSDPSTRLSCIIILPLLQIMTDPDVFFKIEVQFEHLDPRIQRPKRIRLHPYQDSQPWFKILFTAPHIILPGNLTGVIIVFCLVV